MDKKRSLLAIAKNYKKVGLIYRAYNKITDKSYIGQTKYSMEHRRKGHYDAAWVRKGISTVHFMRALRRYKKNDWEWTILEHIDLDGLDNREIYWVAFFNSYFDGYNSTLGGQGHRVAIIHSLYHENHGTISGDLKKLNYEIGIKADSISAMNKDNLNQWHGWVLNKYKDDYNKYVKNSKVHKLYSRETGYVTGKAKELKDKYNINVHTLTTRDRVKGFVKIDNKSRYTEILGLHIYEHIESGVTVEMSVTDFRKYSGIDTTHMFKNHRDGHTLIIDGWKMVDIQEYLDL